MKTKTKLTVLLAILAMTCWAGTASADLLDVTYYLTTFNVAGYIGPYVKVDVAIVDATNATITETGLSHGSDNYYIHGQDAVGFNFTSNVTGVSAPANYSLLPSNQLPHQMDSYGFFNWVYDDTNPNFPGTQGPIEFDITGSGFTANITSLFLGNGLGNFLCDRIGVIVDSETHFDQGGTATGFVDTAVQGPPGGVPLPPSVLLLGSGIFGLGLLGWRRKIT
jgi:hypothetical protein